jgi:hypothetical protein
MLRLPRQLDRRLLGCTLGAVEAGESVQAGRQIACAPAPVDLEFANAGA